MTDIKQKNPSAKESDRAHDKGADQPRVPTDKPADDKSDTRKKPAPDTVARDEEQDDRFQATDN